MIPQEQCTRPWLLHITVHQKKSVQLGRKVWDESRSQEVLRVDGWHQNDPGQPEVPSMRQYWSNLIIKIAMAGAEETDGSAVRAIAEDLGSVPTIHMAAHTCPKF